LYLITAIVLDNDPVWWIIAVLALMKASTMLDRMLIDTEIEKFLLKF